MNPGMKDARSRVLDDPTAGPAFGAQNRPTSGGGPLRQVGGPGEQEFWSGRTLCDARYMGRIGWSRRLAIGVVAGGVLVGGCGGSGGSGPAISSGVLAGTIGGEAWSIVSGETDFFISSQGSDFFTTFYEETVDPCTGAGFSVSTNQVIAEIPMATGDYMQAVTFVVDPGGTNDNLITNGHVVVDQVTATTVSGGLYAKFDANDVVSGQFQATICTQ